MTTKPKGKVFQLPRSKLKMDRERGVLSAAVNTMASNARVMAATPSLKNLYEFLARKLP